MEVRHPESSRKGTFPREYLPKGESVLFETRPSLWPYLGYGLGGLFGLTVLGVLIWILASALAAQGSTSTPAAVWHLISAMFVLVGGTVLAVSLVAWYFTSYAVTTRRVIRKTGWLSRLVVDARFDKIQAVTLTETVGSRIRGYGNLLFSLSAPGASLSLFSGVRQGGILWRAVPQPMVVRSFIESAIESPAALGMGLLPEH